MNGNETTILMSLLGGFLGSISGVWLIKKFVGSGIEHLFKVALQARDKVGTSDLEYRKTQLSEFYGPIHAYLRLTDELYDLWMAKQLQDINVEIIDLFRKQNEEVIQILTTKLHLVEGDEIPPSFARFMTAVTLWNLYTKREPHHSVPDDVAKLSQAKFPEDFSKYIYTTTALLKRKLDDLHRKYGIT